MDEIRNWAVNLIVILIVCAVLKFIMPPGSVTKSAKIVLSLIVLAVMLSFGSAVKNIDISFDFFEGVEMTEQTEPYTAAVEKTVSSTLENEGIACSSVSVDGWLGDDGVYVIYSVEISVRSADKQRALSVLENSLGIERGAVTVNEN